MTHQDAASAGPEPSDLNRKRQGQKKRSIREEGRAKGAIFASGRRRLTDTRLFDPYRWAGAKFSTVK